MDERNDWTELFESPQATVTLCWVKYVRRNTCLAQVLTVESRKPEDLPVPNFVWVPARFFGVFSPFVRYRCVLATTCAVFEIVQCRKTYAHYDTAIVPLAARKRFSVRGTAASREDEPWAFEKNNAARGAHADAVPNENAGGFACTRLMELYGGTHAPLAHRLNREKRPCLEETWAVVRLHSVELACYGTWDASVPPSIGGLRTYYNLWWTRAKRKMRGAKTISTVTKRLAEDALLKNADLSALWNGALGSDIRTDVAEKIACCFFDPCVLQLAPYYDPSVLMRLAPADQWVLGQVVARPSAALLTDVRHREAAKWGWPRTTGVASLPSMTTTAWRRAVAEGALVVDDDALAACVHERFSVTGGDQEFCEYNDRVQRAWQSRFRKGLAFGPRGCGMPMRSCQATDELACKVFSGRVAPLALLDVVYNLTNWLQCLGTRVLFYTHQSPLLGSSVALFLRHVVRFLEGRQVDTQNIYIVPDEATRAVLARQRTPSFLPHAVPDVAAARECTGLRWVILRADRLGTLQFDVLVRWICAIDPEAVFVFVGIQHFSAGAAQRGVGAPWTDLCETMCKAQVFRGNPPHDCGTPNDSATVLRKLLASPVDDSLACAQLRDTMNGGKSVRRKPLALCQDAANSIRDFIKEQCSTRRKESARHRWQVFYCGVQNEDCRLRSRDVYPNVEPYDPGTGRVVSGQELFVHETGCVVRVTGCYASVGTELASVDHCVVYNITHVVSYEPLDNSSLTDAQNVDHAACCVTSGRFMRLASHRLEDGLAVPISEWNGPPLTNSLLVFGKGGEWADVYHYSLTTQENVFIRLVDDVSLAQFFLVLGQGPPTRPFLSNLFVEEQAQGRASVAASSDSFSDAELDLCVGEQ